MFLSFFLATSLALGAEPVAPEVAVDGFVVRPTFEVAGEKTPAGGFAFVITEAEATVAVTAYQLLGPPSGMAVIPGARVPSKVTRLILGTADSNTWLANTTGPMATPMEVLGATASRDVLLATIPAAVDKTATLTTQERAGVKPRALASESPAKGEPIWLVAPLPNAPAAGSLHRGTVAEVNGDFMFYDIPDASLDLAGSSGAPLVNAAGEVVGMQVGVIRFEDGALAGSAVPLSALRARLSDGQKAKKP